MKRPSPHFEIIRLMENTALISPELMEGKDQILEGHNQSSSRPGQLWNGPMIDQKIRCEANRNPRTLSSNNPSMINELYQDRDRGSFDFCFTRVSHLYVEVTVGTLDVWSKGSLLSHNLIK